MAIEEITKYRVGSTEFTSRESAEQFQYDMVGSFMDKAPLLLHPGDRIKLVNFITQNRKALRNLLDY